MPRVCLLTETFYPVVGGGETHARLLSAELNAFGHPTFVLTGRSFRYLPSLDAVGPTPVHRVSSIRHKRWGKYTMTPFAFRALVRLRSEYDLIYVCGFRVLGLPAILAAEHLGKRCVLRAEVLGEMSGKYATAHGQLPSIVSSIYSGGIAARNIFLRRADAFVGISSPIREEFTQCGVPADRLHAIPNGIDPEIFRPASLREKHDLRHRLGLPNGVLAVYTGKLNRGKGLEHLVEAWDTVTRNFGEAHLVLVGSGGNQSLSCEGELRCAVRERGLEAWVTFTGYVDNVHEYLQAADLFVFPSENEAFGLSLAEAMSCGLPCIASRVGGIPEIVSHLENGVLVEPADPDALAWGVIALLEQPELRRVLGHAGRESVRARYSIRTIAQRHVELFESLCTPQCP